MDYLSSEILQREECPTRLCKLLAIRLFRDGSKIPETAVAKSEGLLQLTASLAGEKILAGCLGFFKTRRITPRSQESALAFPSFTETARVNCIVCQLAVKTADLFDTLVGYLGLSRLGGLPRVVESLPWLSKLH